jgi:hypothetical protein
MHGDIAKNPARHKRRSFLARDLNKEVASSVAAKALLYCLAPDTLYLPAQALRMLRLTSASNPMATLRYALLAGWLTQEPTGEVGYAARCWLPYSSPRSKHSEIYREFL